MSAPNDPSGAHTFRSNFSRRKFSIEHLTTCLENCYICAKRLVLFFLFAFDRYIFFFKTVRLLNVRFLFTRLSSYKKGRKQVASHGVLFCVSSVPYEKKKKN